MSDMLSIGSSALSAYTTALSTIGNNIANASTPGYARETTNLSNVAGSGLTVTGGIGGGVQVQSIQRLTNTFYQNQLIVDSASYGRISAVSTYASQLDNWLSSSSSGLAAPLQTFFTDLNTLSQNPTSTAARQTVMTDAQALTGAFNSMQSNLNGMSQQIDNTVNSTVTQINDYAKQLADLNQQIARQTAPGGTPPNALVDQQQELLQELSGQVGISTVTNPNGTVNVFVGTGQPLVVDSTANTMSVTTDQYGLNQQITLATGGGVNANITQQLEGGTLGGLLDFQREILDPAINQVGLMAVTLANAVNTQQGLGMDQYGQLGQALFTTPSVSVVGSVKNTGGATVAGSVTDPGQLSASDYVLAYDGAQWTLTDQSTGTATVLTGTGTAVDPLVGDGMSFVLGGTAAAAGDTYLIQPTALAAGEIGMATTDPARLATASPLQTSASTANTGTGVISSATVSDVTDPNLLNTVTIQFTSATTYSINGAGSYAYTSGSTITYDGWNLQISGVPATGDTFTVSAGNGSSTDNTNAVALANILTQPILSGGTVSLSGANTALVSQVGSQAAQASAQLSAVTAQQAADTAAQQSVSGVNLDEEAAALTQFQQAYQAAAQIISTSNTLFQALLNAIG